MCLYLSITNRSKLNSFKSVLSSALLIMKNMDTKRHTLVACRLPLTFKWQSEMRDGVERTSITQAIAVLLLYRQFTPTTRRSKNVKWHIKFVHKSHADIHKQPDLACSGRWAFFHTPAAHRTTVSYGKEFGFCWFLLVVVVVNFSLIFCAPSVVRSWLQLNIYIWYEPRTLTLYEGIRCQ